MNKMEIRCTATDFRSGIEFRARIPHGNGHSYMLEPAFDVLLEGGYAPPAFVLSMDDAQRLMDELWDCGLRPTEGSGSAGALAATQRHLEDMRKLVFAKDSAEG